MKRRHALTLGAALAALAVGCDPAPVDVGPLSLTLWEPALLADGSTTSPLDDASSIAITVTAETGAGASATFGNGDPLSLPDVDVDPAGDVVTVVVETSGGSLADGIARTGSLAVAVDSAVEAVAVLAPTDGVHTLVGNLPDSRTEAAICAAPDGRVWIIGGIQGGSLSAGSFALSPTDRSVVEGPGLLARRRAAACVFDGEGIWLSPACDENGDGVGELLYAAPDDATFSPRGEAYAAAASTCGATMANDDGGLWLAMGGQLDRLDDEGARQTPTTLSPTRHRPQLQPVAGGVLVVGGFDAAEGGAPVGGAAFVSESGVSTPVDGLDGAVMATAVAAGDRASAIADGAWVSLDEDGIDAVLLSPNELALPVGFVPAAAAALAHDAVAVLSAAGDRLHIANGETAMTRDVVPARPGAHLFPDPGGAVRIVGGGVPGVAVAVAVRP